MMNIQKENNVVRMINEYIELCDIFGYISNNDLKRITNKLGYMTIKCSRCVDDVMFISDTIIYNPDLLLSDNMYEIFYKKLTRYLISCVPSTDTDLIVKGFSLLSDVVCEEVATNFTSYINKSCIPNYSTYTIPGTSLSYKSKYKSKAFGEELVIKFDRTFKGNKNKDDRECMKDIIRLAFKEDFVTSLLEKYNFNGDDFTRLFKQLYYMGFIYDVTEKLKNDKEVSGELIGSLNDAMEKVYNKEKVKVPFIFFSKH